MHLSKRRKKKKQRRLPLHYLQVPVSTCDEGKRRIFLQNFRLHPFMKFLFNEIIGSIKEKEKNSKLIVIKYTMQSRRTYNEYEHSASLAISDWVC